MRKTLHKLLTSSLLATYASISLLGQGLHLLTPDDGHHHGSSVVICTTHSHEHATHEHAAHEAADEHVPASPSAVATISAADAHNCEICDFLAQSVSQPPQIATTPEFGVLVSDIPCQLQGLYSSTLLGLHAPRGPPQLLA